MFHSLSEKTIQQCIVSKFKYNHRCQIYGNLQTFQHMFFWDRFIEHFIASDMDAVTMAIPVDNFSKANKLLE